MQNSASNINRLVDWLVKSFDQVDWLANLQLVNWRPVTIVCGISFLFANVATIYITNLLLDNEQSMFSNPDLEIKNSSPLDARTLSSKDIKDIIDRNIFNSDGKVPDEDDEQKKQGGKGRGQLVPTSLPLKLHGTIYGSSSLASIAMIENTSKSIINSFLIGDRIIENAILKEIQRERIILERDGVYEYLDFPKPEVLDRRGKKVSTSKPNSALSSLSPLAQSPPPPEYKEEGFERKGGKVSMTGSFKNRILGVDFAKVLADAKADPYIVDGEIKGYVLSKIREDSIYRKLGLQDGDIIDEVNGTPLGDPAQAIKLLNSLRNEGKFEVNVIRNGTSASYSIDVN
ncbi:MAG: hypothetical protein KBD78_00455 [Oligoflexales bacterium]|nr:hypothetical protein [Oligoflexales bacterium]